MKYNFDQIIDRNHTWSIKHDFKKENGKPEDILPLWVADMDFVSPQSVLDTLAEVSAHGVFGYTKADDRYFQSVADWYQRRFDWKLEREWMICTPGVVFAVSAAILAFTRETEAVVIQPPVYHPFRRAIERNHRTLVENPLVLEDGHYRMDLEDLERKITESNAKLMILCNPHNPIGRVWSHEELSAVSEICLRHQVFVISDEIHGDFIWPGYVQTPYASLSEEAEQFSMICTAPSKTFNLAGCQTSNIFIPNQEMRRKLRAKLLDLGAENINRMGLFACEAAYRGGEEWLKQLLSYLYENLALVRDFTKNRMPEIQLIEPEGTYLAWLDCRGMKLSEEALIDFFSNEAKVWLDHGSHSGTEGTGFMRFNLGSPRSVIAEALDRIERAWKTRAEKQSL